MKNYGGFSHNEQSFRIVTSLEQKYAEFDGLNLTFETLEGLVKHQGKASSKLSEDILYYNGQKSFELNKYASLEAQVAGISDDIAYDNHDIQDGVKAGLLN
jgi:dGTPase